MRGDTLITFEFFARSLIKTKNRPMRILYISYPLLTVSDESAGGAEQMLWTLEREMAVRGVETTVAASAGSTVSGELFVTGEPCSVPDDFQRRNREHQDRIIEFVRTRARQGRPFDLVHDESGSFWPRVGEIGAPLLATLHLPRSFYFPELFQNIPANVFFNCVSGSQARSFADLKPAVIPNGIYLEFYEHGINSNVNNPGVETLHCNVSPSSRAKRLHLLWLGRICEEKAPHLALEIAARAGERIMLAGQVYPFSYHQQYFETEVLPRLEQMPNALFISSPSAQHKRELLREVRAVLITGQADETSSLVAMEAAASGTPVIAFRRGALPEIVKDGVTGFLVNRTDEAVAALSRVDEIASSACIAHARENFSSARMADGYWHLYSRIVRSRNPATNAA
jgi:glycosyltransferase involved in cell wall biosynthesis